MKYLVLLLMTASGVVNATSFDCKKAATLVEKEICSNELLSRLDDALKKNYDGALVTNIGEENKQDMKKTQRLWLKERNACKTTKCIEKKYRERIDVLCDYAAAAITGVNWGCVVTSDDIL